MIHKPFSKHEPSDPLLNAGWEAEKQLAFYLEREYGAAKDVFVFNDLRFADVSGGFTQIDHLILYRHGIAIIESKSVSGELKVDRLGQWRRKWRSRSGRGGDDNIPDPLAQAERQAASLRRVLDSAEPPLLNKIVGLLQKYFGDFPIMPFVAISDNGRFSGDTRPYAEKVMKADQITGQINDQIASHRRHSGVKSLIFSKPEELTIFNLADDEL
ncbi:MAG: nuclease-related domain-containing protein, partial [Phycisphaerales bacterium]